jgi:ATP phosphoribosyltransferase
MNRRKNDLLTIALPKGRLLKETVDLFGRAGISAVEALKDERKLLFENKKERVRFMTIRAQDVPTYVEYGAADMGVGGKDLLVEQPRDLYEPLDLGIGRCRMVVAEPTTLRLKDNPERWTRIRVATKYPSITLRYFREKGVEVEIIKLYGSIELAPILGLSERIVDLVQTGKTLRRNGLSEVETIMEVASKLITNRASMKTKPERIKEVIEKLERAIARSARK